MCSMRSPSCAPVLTACPVLRACAGMHVLPVLQVREIGNQVAPEPFRWTAEALLALQEVRVSST